MDQQAEKFKVVILLIVVLTLIGTIYDWQATTISTITNWLLAIGTGFILSGVAGGIIESFSGNYLKNILIPIKIGEFTFSISVFFILTIGLRFWLFN
jgi:hypothetical protein